MEGFILFLVVAGISFLVKNLKGEESDTAQKRKQMPPIGQGPTSKPQTRTSQQQNNGGLGSFMKEITSELDKQFGEPKVKEAQKHVQKTTPKTLEIYDEEKTTAIAREQGLQATKEKAKALQAERQKTLNRAKRHSSSVKKSLVPSSKKGMAQAIIMSEILAPPISKRRRS